MDLLLIQLTTGDARATMRRRHGCLMTVLARGSVLAKYFAMLCVGNSKVSHFVRCSLKWDASKKSVFVKNYDGSSIRAHRCLD